MHEAFVRAMSQARTIFERAQANGWLTDAELERLDAIERQAPADLFAAAEARPLVVAFFGGTGVGKSSLLNRLAGQAIARTGVERPTSREVTIYLHEAVELATLPPGLPVEHVQIRRHAVAAQRDILWIDAPDIDSTYEANRKLALAWLPHIDLLIYVVSPERYRDDVGWRVLRRRGHRHGWMFVLNRWDEGDTSQKGDFAQMLRDVGFSEPLLVCTSCAPPTGDDGSSLYAETAPSLPSPDEFEQIEAAIRALLAEHGVRELERLGCRARLHELRGALSRARQSLGSDADWQNIETCVRRHWQRTRAALQEGLEWPIRAAAGRFAIRQRGAFGRVVGRAVDAAQDEARSALRIPGRRGPRRSRLVEGASDDAVGADAGLLAQPLWDDWTDDKLNECLDAIEVEVRRLGIAATPLRAQLDRVWDRAGEAVRRSVRDRIRSALSQPGTRVQRASRRVTGFLTAALPFFALLWVAYNVVTGYYRASTGVGDYPTGNFAIGSLMLIAVAWAVPFVCDRMLRPSLERTALGAMRQGLGSGLDALGEQLCRAAAGSAQAARSIRAEADALMGEVSRFALQPIEVGKPMLSRVVSAPSRTTAAL